MDTPRLVIAVDPGATTGWAQFWDGQLELAGHGAPTRVRAELSEWQHLAICRLVVIEVPRVYPQEREVDGNDLIALAVIVGEFKRFFEGDTKTAIVELVPPRTWKGTAPKRVTNQRTLQRLNNTEITLLPRRPLAKDYDHNMLDAVGLGLWQLGRLVIR